MYNYALVFAISASFGEEFGEGNSYSVNYFFVGVGKITKSICFFIKSSGNNSELCLRFRCGIFRFLAERFFVKNFVFALFRSFAAAEMQNPLER